MALKGDANFTSQPIVLAGASPVDAKMMVALKSDLTSYATWQAPSGAVGGNANLMFNYFGMLVYVGNDPTAENNGLYVLQKNETDEVLQANAYYSNSIFRKDLANVASTYASCWVRISQTDATIEAIREALETKQSESISVSGLTGETVQAVLEDISTRLAGVATDSNLEDLSNRVTTLEGKVEAIETFSVQVVDELPDSGEEKVIYLVPTKDGKEKEEYIWIASDNKFELIGTTHVSLAGYATETYVDGKASAAEAAAIAAAKTETEGQVSAAKSEIKLVTDALAGRVEANESAISGINTTLESVATKTEVATAKSEAISEAGTAADGKISTALANYDTTTVSEGKIAAAKSEAITAAKTETEGQISVATTALEGKIATAKGEAIAAAKTETEGQISVAKSELTSAIATAKGEAIAAAKTETESQIAALGIADYAKTSEVTSAIATAKSEAISEAGTAADGKIAAALTAYDTTTVSEGKIATAKQEAIAAAKTETESQIAALNIADYAKTSEVTAAISASEAAIQGKLDNKVESSVYSAKVTELENGIAGAVAAAGTAETNAKAYTDTEVKKVADELAAVKTFSVQVVDELPDTGEEKVIYLVPTKDGKEKEEYLWIDGKFELIGTTHVSLAGYATETYVDGKASAAELAAITAAKSETTSQVSAAKSELTDAIATAKGEAISTAAEDATSKANTAESNAKDYTDAEVAKITPESLTNTPEKKASWKSLLSFVDAADVKTITNVVAYENEDESGISGVEVASTEVIKYYSIPANTATSIVVSSTAISKLSFFGTTASVEMTIDGANGEAVYESVIGDADWSISGNTPAVSITSKVAGTLKVSYIKEA